MTSGLFVKLLNDVKRTQNFAVEFLQVTSFADFKWPNLKDSADTIF